MHTDNWSTLDRLPTQPPAQSRHGIAGEVFQNNQCRRRAAEAKQVKQQRLTRLIRLLATLAAFVLYRTAALLQRLARVIQPASRNNASQAFPNTL